MASMLQITILVSCIVAAFALSEPIRKQGTFSKSVIHDHKEKAEESEDCQDSVSRCTVAGIKERICSDPIRKQFCKKTCHVCHQKAPSPVINCAASAFGCCWDGITAKAGYYNEGCPPCIDDKVFAGLCRRWLKHCTSNTENKIYHEFAVKYCHRTCGKCGIKKPTPRPRKTLPPIIVQESHSDNKPRIGAKYVWTKVQDFS